MSSVLGWALGGIGLAAAVFAVIQYLRGAAANKTALDERDSALQLEQDRVDAMEKAAADAARQSKDELDEKAAAVRTTDDAAALVRGELARARRAQAPKQVQSAPGYSGTGIGFTAQP